MPSYDFTCQDCGETWTDIRRFDDPPPDCPACESTDVLKHFPCPAVHIFYSPCHPRHKRGMVGQKPPPLEPQFRDGKGPKKKKRKGKKK